VPTVPPPGPFGPPADWPSERIPRDARTGTAAPGLAPAATAAPATPGGGSFRLSWWIRAWRWITGMGIPAIHHGARIHHANVTRAGRVHAEAPGRVPGWGSWHPSPGRAERADSATIRPARRLIIEALIRL